MGMRQISKFEVVSAAHALLKEDGRERAGRARQLRCNVVLAALLLAAFLFAGLASFIGMRHGGEAAAAPPSVNTVTGETR